uniref:Uncharacterized protein n=1 Tax=Rhizophora mucronata TaxID=61149 RepID=A0A2P2QAN1_RHIMU
MNPRQGQRKQHSLELLPSSLRALLHHVTQLDGDQMCQSYPQHHQKNYDLPGMIYHSRMKFLPGECGQSSSSLHQAWHPAIHLNHPHLYQATQLKSAQRLYFYWNSCIPSNHSLSSVQNVPAALRTMMNRHHHQPAYSSAIPQ